MPLFVTVAGLVSSGGTFLKRACVSSLTRSRMALTFTPGKEPDAIIYLCHPPPSSLLKDGAGICHYSLNSLKPGVLLFTSFSPLCDSSFIHHSLLCSLSSFFYLPAVESLPNEVADGSILLRDRVERLPTLKSINLTVSISTQTSLSTLFKTKKKKEHNSVLLHAVALLVPVSLSSQITHDSTFRVCAVSFV